MSNNQIAAMVQQQVQAALMQFTAPVKVAPQPSVSKGANGKIKVSGAPKPAASNKPKREDPRIPETIVEIAPGVTLGYSKSMKVTGKDGKERDTDFGFGVQFTDPETGNVTMIFHKARKWAQLAKLAVLVNDAINTRYE